MARGSALLLDETFEAGDDRFLDEVLATGNAKLLVLDGDRRPPPLPAADRRLARVRHVVDEEGFRLPPDEGRIQRSGRRQEVTGLVVNQPCVTLPHCEVAETSYDRCVPS